MAPPEFPTLVRLITQEMVDDYGHVNDDKNLLHYSPEAAREAGFPAPVVHGALSAAILSRACAEIFADRWVEGGSLSVRFRRPLLVGDELTTGGKLERTVTRARGVLATYAVWCTNRDGEVVLDGTAMGTVSS